MFGKSSRTALNMEMFMITQMPRRGDGGQNDQCLDDFQPAYKQDAQDEYGKRNAPDVL